MSSSRSSRAPATAFTPTSEQASASASSSASSSAKNESIRRGYRSRRCPRWRLRVDHVDGARGGRPKTLLYDADGGEPFQKVAETRDGIVVWMRASPDPSCAVKEVLAEAVFPGVTRDAFWRAVCDVERYAEFVPFVRESRVVRRDALTGDVWVYNAVKPPVASARDYTIRVSSRPAAGADQPHRSSWTADPREGPGPRKGAIRLAQNRGSWELRGTREGSVALRYRVLTDPGAALPAWLVDAANKSSVPDVLRAFAARATSDAYSLVEEAEGRPRSKFEFGFGFGSRGVAVMGAGARSDAWRATGELARRAAAAAATGRDKWCASRIGGSSE